VSATVPPGGDVGGVLASWAATTPSAAALTWVPFEGPPVSWTYAALRHDVLRLAAGLAHRGVRAGDPVALVMPNCPDVVLAWAALLHLGAVAVCADPRSSAAELGYLIDHSGAVGAIVDPVSAAVAREGLDRLAWVVESTGCPQPGQGTGLLMSDPPSGYPTVPGQAAASIQYTSGTTSRPKAVVWTQANCLWAGRVGAAHQGLTQADTNLVHLPLFHTNALSYSLLSTLYAGGHVVLQPRFSASRFWPVAVEHGATWSALVSFCVRALQTRDPLPGHRFRGWGNSAALDPAPWSGGVAALGWFGMTETVSHPIIGSLDPRDPPGTMGRPAPEYAVAVLHPDGSPVGVGEVGDLRVRGIPGVSLFAEYLHDPEATAAAVDADGWLRTGDRVRRDEGGTLSFVERAGDLLKVGGENVGAAEIEVVLLQVPGVAEVAVVGAPHEMLGEVPVAFVLPRAGASVTVAELTARCVAGLNPARRPREIRLVDALPRATLDKVAKAVLRGILRDEGVRR
jgi:crotonobetaine/carnitine-CoA ligase